MEANTSKEQVVSGFSWRSYLGLIYTILVFQPAIMYLYLTTGNTLLSAATQWASLILFVELARLSGKPLTKQEATIIFLGSALSSAFALPLLPPWGWIYRLWFKYSPVAMAFNLEKYIPSFYAPVSEEPWIQRTFFHPSWTYAVTVSIIAWLCFRILDLSLSLFVRALYIEVERLPFPTIVPQAEAVVTLTERRKDAMRIFVTAAIISMIYGVLAYSVPFIVQSVGYTFQLIPLPWADFNPTLHHIVKGASLGIATDVLTFVSGFLVSFPVCIAIFIGSFVVYFVGNAILVSLGISEFAKTWAFGMTVQDSWQRSLMYFWISPLIGFSIAAGVLPILLRPKFLKRAFQAVMGKTKTEVMISPLIILIPFFVTSAILIGFIHMLVPDFPILVLVFLNMVWPILYILITSRGMGEAVAFQIPYVPQLSIIASGYGGYDIWFAPLYQQPWNWLGPLKVCDLTRTHPISFIKTYILAWPLALVLGFIYAMMFWKVAPIPSAAYPGVNTFWPVTGALQAIWITHPPEIFQPIMIAAGFIVGSVLFFITNLLHMSALMIGITAGTFTAIPSALTILVGGIIGKVIEIKFGKTRWNRYKGTFAAGLILGQAIILVVGVAIALIIKSMWVMPY